MIDFPSYFLEVEYGHDSETWYVVEHDGWGMFAESGYNLKEDAVREARKTAKKYNAGLIVRGKDGKITEKTRYDE